MMVVLDAHPEILGELLESFPYPKTVRVVHEEELVHRALVTFPGDADPDDADDAIDAWSDAATSVHGYDSFYWYDGPARRYDPDTGLRRHRRTWASADHVAAVLVGAGVAAALLLGGVPDADTAMFSLMTAMTSEALTHTFFEPDYSCAPTTTTLSPLGQESEPLPEPLPGPVTAAGTWTQARLLGEQALGELESLLGDYGAYETDPTAVLDRPVLADLRDGRTAAFHQALGSAERACALYRGDPTADRAGRASAAVAAARTAWIQADAHATRVGRHGLTGRERKAVTRAAAALRVVLDGGASPEERRTAYLAVRRNLDGIVVLPAPALEQIETVVRVAIGAGVPATTGADA